jgi:hypothetical protein
MLCPKDVRVQVPPRPPVYKECWYMSTRNFAESETTPVTPAVAERRRKAAQAVEIVRRIVQNYAVFDDDRSGALWVPQALVEVGGVKTERWLELADETGGNIHSGAVGEAARNSFIGWAAMSKMVRGNGAGIMTIQTSPPEVLKPNGRPLPATQLDDAIVNLTLYEGALAARTE